MEWQLRVAMQRYDGGMDIYVNGSQWKKGFYGHYVAIGIHSFEDEWWAAPMRYVGREQHKDWKPISWKPKDA